MIKDERRAVVDAFVKLLVAQLRRSAEVAPVINTLSAEELAHGYILVAMTIIGHASLTDMTVQDAFGVSGIKRILADIEDDIGTGQIGLVPILPKDIVDDNAN